MLQRYSIALAFTAVLLWIAAPTAWAQSGSADLRTVITTNDGPGGSLVVELQALQTSLTNADGESATTIASATIDFAYDSARLTPSGGSSGVLASNSNYTIVISTPTNPGSSAACTGQFVRTSITADVGPASGFNPPKDGYELPSSYVTLYSFTFTIASDASGTQSFTFCPTSLNLSFYDDEDNSDGDNGTIEAEPADGDVVLNTSEATDVALPVELVSFDAVADGSTGVVLTWETASETNNAGFAIEQRNAEAQDAVAGGAKLGEWREVGFVSGAGTTLQAQRYEHRLTTDQPGVHVYRLRQMDYDGAFEYSAEVEVTVEMAETFVLGAVYPNPFNPSAQFSLRVREPQHVAVTVYDALGRQVARLFDGTLEATTAHVFRLDASQWSSGLYVIRVAGERFASSQTVTLVK